MTKYEYVKESIDNKYNSGEITKTEYDTLLTIIENDEDCHIEMKTSTKAGIAVGVFLGIVPGILTGVALDYLANGNILKLNKDSDAFSGDVHSKIIKVSKFNKMTKEAYRLDESKPLKIRLFHVNNIPLAYCVIANGADANSEDIEYNIIAKKLRGGSFEAELKKYIQNEKNAIKRK